MPGFYTSVAVLMHEQMSSPHLPLWKRPVRNNADTDLIESVGASVIRHAMDYQTSDTVSMGLPRAKCKCYLKNKWWTLRCTWHWRQNDTWTGQDELYALFQGQRRRELGYTLNKENQNVHCCLNGIIADATCNGEYRLFRRHCLMNSLDKVINYTQHSVIRYVIRYY